MDKLEAIPGIGPSSLELLEAAGFLSVDALADARVDELAAELDRANAMLKILRKCPSRKMIQSWIDTAREMTGSPLATEDAKCMPLDHEKTPEGAAMLLNAPFAIPLPAQVLKSQNVAVGDIPPAILLNRYSGELDVRTGQRIPENRHPKSNRQPNTGNFVRLAGSSGKRIDFSTSSLRPIEELSGENSGRVAPKRPSSNDRVSLIRAPRAETNQGRDPKSRRYIRGVLHNNPSSILTGALATLLVCIATPVAMLSALLLLLSGEMPRGFSWVPGWLIWFTVALPVFGICYLIWGLGCKCRICGQWLFRHRYHLKNSRAHHIRGLGYVLPLCIHILLFRWFRCSHCGTPVRLKE